MDETMVLARQARSTDDADLAGSDRGVKEKIDRPSVSPRRSYPSGVWSIRSHRVLAVLLAGAALLLAPSSALAAIPTSPVVPSYLFSIPSASGSLVGPNDKHLTLRLTGTRDYMTRFTDRPLRDAYVVANVDFVRRFKSYFAGSEPNAVLTYAPRGSRIPVSIVLTIGRPRWDAKHATWAFPAIRIRKRPDNLPGSTVHIKPPFIPNPRSFTQATLIIDSNAALPGYGYCVPGILYGTCVCNFLPGTTCENAIYVNVPGEPALLFAPHSVFTGMQLDNDQFLGVNLVAAEFRSTTLYLDFFRSANLSDANFDGSTLTYVHLIDANLTGAYFGGAYLTNVDLEGATGLNLTGAILCNTTLPDNTVDNSGCLPPYTPYSP